MKETILKVEDMTCNHCVASVQNALEQVEGVESAQVSLDDKVARVSHQEEMDPYALLAAVKEVGFTPEIQS